MRNIPFLNFLAKFFLGFILPIALLNNRYINDALTPTWTYFISLLPPIVLFTYEIFKEKSISYYSSLGILNCLMNIFIFNKAPSILIYSVKEATLPLIFFLLFAISKDTKNDFLAQFIIKPIKNGKLDEIKANKDLAKAYNQTYWAMLFSILYSSIMNFILAYSILKSTFGTPEFNLELSKVNSLNLLLNTGPTFLVIILAEYLFMERHKKSVAN